MRTFLEGSVYFPVLCSVLFYLAGEYLRRRLHTELINPLLVSVTLTVLLLILIGMDYETYKDGAKFLSYLLTPVTVCLAIPLYRRLYVLRGNTVAIIAGILAGTVSSIGCILVMCFAFGMSNADTATLLPKSITTAIGMELSEELGGDPSVTAAVIIFTGILGNVTSPLILKLFRINHPIAKGVAIGTSSHAVGTTKALEMGETEGAVSGLSLVVAGIITVMFVSLYSGIL